MKLISVVAGGAGFIGGNFVLDWLADPKAEGIINLCVGHFVKTA